MSDLPRQLAYHQRLTEEPAAGAGAAYEANDDELDIQPYLISLRRYWRLLALLTLLAVIVTAAVSKLWLTPWYMAQAEIKPLGSRLSSHLSLGGTALGQSGSALLGGLGLGGSGDIYDQQTLTAILRSYDFTADLIRTYKLGPILQRSAPKVALSPWKQYETLKRQLGVKYSFADELIELTFADPDPAVAQRILVDYLDLLRGRLRAEEIKQARAAIASLQDEVRHTSDNLLADRLYEFIAQQVQRERLAEVQADFIFLVIEPPVVPDHPYWPRTSVNCLFAAVLTLLIGGFAIIFFDNRGARGLTASAERTAGVKRRGE
jgi:uncharacterized protein involved in exopolysaccharide biosynthesis